MSAGFSGGCPGCATFGSCAFSVMSQGKLCTVKYSPKKLYIPNYYKYFPCENPTYIYFSTIKITTEVVCNLYRAVDSTRNNSTFVLYQNMQAVMADLQLYFE